MRQTPDVGRRHLDRRDQRRPDRRQPARAPRRAAARVLGDGRPRSRSARRSTARRANESGGRDIVNETNATIAMLFGVSGFFAPRVPAAPFQPPRHAGGDQLLRHRAAAPHARATGRLRPAQLGRGAPLGRRGQRAGAATSSTSTAGTGASTRATSWPAAPCRRAFRRSRSTASSTGTAAWSRTRRCSTCSTSRAARPRLVFQVDLFAARGEMPANLGEASEREKDIRYSSRTRLNTTYELRRRRRCRRRVGCVDKLPRGAARRPRRAGARRRCRARPRSTSST